MRALSRGTPGTPGADLADVGGHGQQGGEDRLGGDADAAPCGLGEGFVSGVFDEPVESQVCTIALPQVASIASGRPLRPSQHTNSTSLIPRLRNSASTPPQNRDPSAAPSQMPSTCLNPSASTPVTRYAALFSTAPPSRTLHHQGVDVESGAHRHLRQFVAELEAISIELAGQRGRPHEQPGTSREISPLSAGSAHRNPDKTTGQRVLSVTPNPLRMFRPGN
jgi:hypothetical protein